MKKCAIVLVVLIVLYALAAVVANLVLPQRIADANARHLGVRAAIAKVTRDQRVVGERVHALTSETLDKGLSKAAEVSAILADPALNRIAFAYTGADWSLKRSAFLGQVSHARKLRREQSKPGDEGKASPGEKLKDLEEQKRKLVNNVNRIKTTARLETDIRRTEIQNLESQIVQLRRADAARDNGTRKPDENDPVSIKMKTDENLLRMTLECENSTVGELRDALAKKLDALRWEESEPNRIRGVLSYFDVWPFNKLSGVPAGDGNEK